MAQTSQYYPILQGVQQIVNGLNLLDWTGKPLPSVIRKLPSVDEGIDTALPQLYIVPKDEPAERKAIAFGPVYRVRYPVELVFIASGKMDFTSHLDTYAAWQDVVANAFNLPASLKAIVPSIWDVNVRLGLAIDRTKVNDNYDYGGLTIDAIVTER